MIDDPNFWACLERLDDTVPAAVAAVVEASFSDEADALERALRTGEASHHGERPPQTKPPPMFLKRLRVKGFRGIGPEATLDLPVGPGLTVVTGRNGCGKSSFAEALEWALTGSNSRWRDSAQREELQGGWRNLHQRHGALIEVELTGEIGGSTLGVTWADDVEHPDEGRFYAHVGDLHTRDRSDLEWTAALETFGPILTYASLGDLTRKRSVDLHDQLRPVLGLQSLGDAQKRVRDAKRQVQARRREAKAQRKALQQMLSDIDDPRARSLETALKGHVPAFDAAAQFATTFDHDDSEGVVLRQLVELEAPRVERAATLAAELRTSLAALQARTGTLAERSHRLADVLKSALEWHRSDDTHCPVCTQPSLRPEWPEQAAVRLEEARRDAAEVAEIESELVRLRQAARREVLRAPPPVLRRVVELGLGGAVLDAWTKLSGSRDLSDSGLVHRLLQDVEPVAQSLQAAQAEARGRLDARDEVWKPVADQLSLWLPLGRRAARERDDRLTLDKALDQLKNCERALTADRFGPIAARTQAHWAQLRQRSHVELEAVELTELGSSVRRGVELRVTVDGAEDVALGVMSQGELHSLALSLFLPRMTHPSSPFHFVVLDDPVQAMDPHKVDGLAKLLEQTAKVRQVVVFTHDARLPESIRRLQIAATVLRVERAVRSVVEVKTDRDAVQAYLEEAEAVAWEVGKLGAGVAGTVVAGFCRLAIDAVLVQAYRRRALGAGAEHRAVEQAVADARATGGLAALAMFDDARVERRRVYRRLEQWGGQDSCDTFGECARGVHEGWDGNLRNRVYAAESLAKLLMAKL